MNNKENMKKVIKNDINKSKNYQTILDKIEKNERKDIKEIVAIGSLIMLFIICGIILFNNHKEMTDNNDNVYSYKIVINNMDNVDNGNVSIVGGLYDVAGGFYEKAINELKKEYPFINNLFIFGENTSNQRIGEYRFDEGEPKGYYQGYYVIYTDNTNKGVQIFFSKTMNMQPSDIGSPIILDELEDSYIMGIPVKIIKTGNEYIAFFDKYGVHFDIVMINTSEKELVNLIELIIK